MAKSRLEFIEVKVAELLENYPECRENDHKLYAMYIQEYHFIEFNVNTFINYNDYGIPPFESVSRCKRKLQEKHTTLKPSAEVKINKEYAKQEYENYALDKE